MLTVKQCADNWDVFNRTERLALLRMLPFAVGSQEVGWANPSGEDGNHWAQIHPLIQHALMQLDWEFALGRRLPGWVNE